MVNTHLENWWLEPKDHPVEKEKHLPNLQFCFFWLHNLKFCRVDLHPMLKGSHIFQTIILGIQPLLFGSCNPKLDGFCEKTIRQATRCFEPCDTFVGARSGFAFKLGDQGDDRFSWIDSVPIASMYGKGSRDPFSNVIPCNSHRIHIIWFVYLHVWYIYLITLWVVFYGFHVGKYTSPMDPMACKEFFERLTYPAIFPPLYGYINGGDCSNLILCFLKWWSPQNMYLEWTNSRKCRVPHINTQNDHHFKETAVSQWEIGRISWTVVGEMGEIDL